MDRTISPPAARRLVDRAPLPVDPGRAIAIKRDVHEFAIDTDARTFAHAFRDLLIDAHSVFGLIRVKRAADRLGAGFEVGERFQGCFSLAMALGADRGSRWLRQVLGLAPSRWLIGVVEDRFLSDYAEVLEIQMEPDLERGEPYRLRYGYLEGTPIAGSTTFLVEPQGEERCRVVQILEYQEIDAIALGLFQGAGLKMHDQVVNEQVRQAAERAGARVLSATIPASYGQR